MEVKDLVEDWIAIRSILSRHLAALRSQQVSPNDAIPNATIEATVTRLEAWLRDLNALLKSYASAKPTSPHQSFGT